MLPSGPVVMPCGPLGAEGVVYSAIIWPDRLIRPIFFPGPTECAFGSHSPPSVNQMLLSGPTVIPVGLAPSGRLPYSAKLLPSAVTLPMRAFVCSANHRAPSGPAVMS